MFREIEFTQIKDNFVDLLKNRFALVTAGNSEKFNTMTVSWGAAGELWGKDMVTVYIRPQRSITALLVIRSLLLQPTNKQLKIKLWL